MESVTVWADIMFTVVCQPCPQAPEYTMEFRAYEIVAFMPDAAHEYAATGSDELTDDLAKASVYVSGSVKWDGCSNLQFDAQDDGVQLHFCSRQSAANIGVLLGRIYDLAAQTIPNWSV